MPLKITIPGIELWDEKKEEFVSTKDQTLQLEHSLVSISKWEAKWKKPFLDERTVKTPDELRDYIRCMTLTQNVDPKVYKFMPPSVIKEITEYMEDPMTASWISEKKKTSGGSGEIVTSELVYYWMIAYNIPIEFQKWHFNRLMMLIRICDAKNAPQKKMGRTEMLQRNRALNAQRRAKHHTRG